MLELTDPAVRAAWGLAREDLAAGGAAAPAGAQVADNLAIFADRRHPGSDVRVVQSERLSPEER